MSESITPHLDYAQDCFLYAHMSERSDWRQNWLTAMWMNLLWAAEGGELKLLARLLEAA